MKYEQLYQEALVVLIAELTTEDSEGIWWEEDGIPIKIKRFGEQFRIIYNNHTMWILNDRIHRDDGPAIEFSSGTKCWYLNGIRYTYEEFLKLTK